MALFQKKSPPIEPDMAAAEAQIPMENTPLTDTPVIPNADGSVTGVIRSHEEKVLDYFQYSADATSYEWEKENPIRVPREIAEKYPQFTFRWRAKDPKGKEGLSKGNNYHGWQTFQDKAHPTGVEYGGDLVLCAMPNERAESYRRYVQQQSTEQVRGMQEEQLNALERAGAGLPEFRSLEPGEELTDASGRKSAPAGITVGANARGQHRGIPPEELRERFIRQQEDRKRGRKYYT